MNPLAAIEPASPGTLSNMTESAPPEGAAAFALMFEAPAIEGTLDAVVDTSNVALRTADMPDPTTVPPDAGGVSLPEALVVDDSKPLAALAEIATGKQLDISTPGGVISRVVLAGGNAAQTAFLQKGGDIADVPVNVGPRDTQPPASPRLAGVQSMAQNIIEGRVAAPTMAGAPYLSQDALRPKAELPLKPGSVNSDPLLKTASTVSVPAAPMQTPATGLIAGAPVADPAPFKRDRPQGDGPAASPEKTVNPTAPMRTNAPNQAPVAVSHFRAQQIGVAQDAKGQTVFEGEIAQSIVGSDRTSVATSTSAVATPTAAEPARHVAQQIASAVVQNNGKVTEIALNPEELGRVRLLLSATDGALTLTVLTERPETQDLLRRHIDVLAQEFRELGYDALSFSFGSNASAGEQTPKEAPADDTDTGAPVQGSAAVEGISSSVGVDIRL